MNGFEAILRVSSVYLWTISECVCTVERLTSNIIGYVRKCIVSETWRNASIEFLPEVTLTNPVGVPHFRSNAFNMMHES